MEECYEFLIDLLQVLLALALDVVMLVIILGTIALFAVGVINEWKDLHGRR